MQEKASCSKDYGTVEPKNLAKLSSSTHKAIQECEENFNMWKTHTIEYRELKDRLETFADELSYDVMVPFGKCAFMPGKIVHTNEVLVLLGDNWFADRSTRQAVDIVHRRLQYCEKMLKQCEEEKSFHESKVKALDHFLTEFDDNEVEIVEKMPEDDQEVQVQPKRRVQWNDPAPYVTDVDACNEPRKINDADFRSLINRLDELEKQEELEEKAIREKDSNDEDSDFDEDSQSQTNHPVHVKRESIQELAVKKVSWHANEELGYCNETDETVAGSKDSGNFVTTPSTSKASEGSKQNVPSLKSILKNRQESTPVDQNLVDQMNEKPCTPVILPESVEAFSGIIKENVVSAVNEAGMQVSKVHSPTPCKRMSKFRVQRTAMQ